MELNSNQNIQEIPTSTSPFLDTAFRLKMQQPHGVFTFLEMPEPPSTDGAPVLSLEVKNKVLQAETYQVNANVQLSTIKDLQRMGIDGTRETVSALVNESTLNFEKILVNKYTELGKNSYYSDFTKWQKFLNKYFKLEFPIYLDEDQICAKILEISLKIAKKSRRGSANFVVVSPKVFEYIRLSPMFEYNSDESYTGLSYNVGRIQHINVFINHNLTSEDIIVGMNTRDNNPGVVYGEYSRQFMQNERYETNSIDFQLRDRSVIASIGDTASNSYYTAPVSFGKKSIWRKLIKI
jgi:hypothetical protein